MTDKNAMLRLFIALEIPQELRRALNRYEKELPFWKWTPGDRMHMTMRFILIVLCSISLTRLG